MRKFTKLLCLIIAVCLLASMSVACGKSSNDTGSTTVSESAAASASEAASEEKKLEKVEITVLTGADQPDQPDAKLVFEEISKASEQELNINLKVQSYAWGDYIQKAKTMSAAGEEFDIFLSFYGELYGNVQRKQCIPIDDLLDKYGSDIKANIPEGYFVDASIDGKKYGVPAVYPTAGGGGTIIRKDLREKYGIPEIKDLAGYEQYLDAIAKNEKGMFPYVSKIGRGGGDLNLAWEGQNLFFAYQDENSPVAVIDITKKPYKVENYFKSDVAKKKAEWYKKAYKAGWIPKEILVIKDENTLFQSGKAASVPSDMWNINAIAPALRTNVPGAELEIISFYDTEKAVKLGRYNNFAFISGTSKNPERAMMFLNWIQKSRDNYDLMYFGIKGKHWNAIGDDKWELPAGVDPAQRAYNPSPWWFKNMKYDRLDKNAEPEFVKAYNRAVNAKVTTPAIALFAADSTSYKTEMAQISTVILEKWLPVMNGIKSTDADYQEAVNALDKAGVEKAIAEIQKQVDEWAKVNDP